MKLVLLFALICPLLSFSKTYKIPEGKHSKTRIPNFFWGKEFRFVAMFDNSALYESEDRSINKLMGFSDCGFNHHHKNSARVGWRVVNGEIELLGYVYKNGSRVTQDGDQGYHLGWIRPNEPGSFKIKIERSEYVFSYQTEERVNSIRMPRGCSKKNGLGYRLYPYFGGSEVAPHDISIDVVVY